MISLFLRFASFVGQGASALFTAGPRLKGDNHAPVDYSTKGILRRNLNKLKLVLINFNYRFPEEEIALAISANPSYDGREWKQSVAALMKFCGLDHVQANLTFEALRPMPGHVAGCVTEVSKGQYTIWVDPSYAGKPEVIAAILAHEVAHVYAGVHSLRFNPNVSSRGNDASEQMTDLMAIALGMGNLLVNGCVFEPTPFSRRHFGYLSPKAIEFSYNYWQSIRGSR